ncbi:MAG: UDP-glucose 6-dehydrogenase TuaD [Holosporales bacterium]
MKIAVIGTGYVGLVSGTCFAQLGFDVACVDINPKKIENLSQGILPIYEPGLDVLIEKNKDRLTFTTSLQDAMKNAAIVMIAVGTPTDEQCPKGQADLSYVFKAAQDIAKNLNGYQIVLTKSTVPVGTGQKIQEIIKEQRPDLKIHDDYDVASNPEFLREGSAIDDFMNPDRIVIGIDNNKAAENLRKLYAPLVEKGHVLFETNIQTAELIKYAANAFLATKIAFINEISDLCESVHAKVLDVSTAIGLDSRIGPKFLNPGPGFGGSCFPKDTKALAVLGQTFNKPVTIVETVIQSNEQRKINLANRLFTVLKQQNAQRIAILGLTFKANTDDLRDAASLEIVPYLRQRGFDVVLYDPLYHQANKADHPAFASCSWGSSIEDAVQNSDAICILTEWDAFKTLNLADLKTKMRARKPILCDYRALYKFEDAAGFHFIQLGKDDQSCS